MNISKVFNVCNIDDSSSSYIPYVSFPTQESKNIAELYVVNEANFFFKNILKIQKQVELISYAKSITWENFHQVNIQDFYDLLFFDLGDRDSDGKLVHKLKWSLTFDEALTPIQVANFVEDKLDYFDRRNIRRSYCSRRPFPEYRKYGFISANGEPVLYYLHFTLQEILDALKTDQFSKLNLEYVKGNSQLSKTPATLNFRPSEERIEFNISLYKEQKSPQTQSQNDKFFEILWNIILQQMKNSSAELFRLYAQLISLTNSQAIVSVHPNFLKLLEGKLEFLQKAMSQVVGYSVQIELLSC